MLLFYLVLNYTKLGLRMRATTQIREMASALGVNTRWVDGCTLRLGSGLAGVAGYGMTVIGGVSPDMGQNYIVESFLVVVTGGVGELAGTLYAGMGLGVLNKILEPLVRRRLGTGPGPGRHRAVHPDVAPPDCSRQRGDKPMSDVEQAVRPASRPAKTERVSPEVRPCPPSAARFGVGSFIFLAVLLSVPFLQDYWNTGHIQVDRVSTLGRFVAFAIVALSLDLLWGYTGILCLCQSLFFALGGYAMGMYLAMHGPMDCGRHRIPRCLFVVSSAVQGITLPWFWKPFDYLGRRDSAGAADSRRVGVDRRLFRLRAAGSAASTFPFSRSPSPRPLGSSSA